MIGTSRYICLLKCLLLFLIMNLPHDEMYAQNYADDSVLKNGTWYKIAVTEEGVYKITYDNLIEYGINVHNINPKNISLFGNEAGLLPEDNTKPNYDDLSEMSIIVKGENDGSFDENDEIIFYAQSPVTWDYEDGFFVHNTNYYTDTTFYFLRLDNIVEGKRIEQIEDNDNQANKTITTFQDRQVHEIDMNNHYRQGRLWYGEEISLATSTEKRFSFDFDNILPSRTAHARFSLVGASSAEVFYARIKINDEIKIDSIRISKASSHLFGHDIDKKIDFDVTEDDIDIDISVISTSAVSLVGVDYITVNAWRKLRYENETLRFSIVDEQFDNNWQNVIIENAAEGQILLDVTSPLNPVKYTYDIDNLCIKYQIIADELKSFILASESDYKSVHSIKHVSNQNLHSLQSAEMLIITHPLFKEEAERIKQIHEEHDGLYSVVIEVQDIYNEFSSGAPDITGIRNFIRMIYQRDNSLKYVLLMGRGSSDYKNILGADNNFVPPYEAMESYSEISSYVTDDYYGLMDAYEGDDCGGTIDLGIGRIPVSTKQEAQDAVNKILAYIESQKRSYDIDWRDRFLFVADDDATDYAKNCDKYESIIDTSGYAALVDKIFTDSYVREKVTAGYEYPTATEDLINKIEEGRLFVTYVGHGGVKGLTNEGLLREKHINAFRNIDNMPFVHTGTCEFSKFDDPTYVSAGEKLFLNPNGGAIGMITTTRPTQSSSNHSLALNLYKTIFKDGRIKDLTFGEMMKQLKMLCPSSSGYLCYVMFGDPALRLAYPQQDIKLNVINTSDANELCVLSPMSEVYVQGEILDEEGQRDTDFNGFIYPKMFDAKSDFTTLDNNETGHTYNFSFYKDIIFEGKAEVKNGQFEFYYPIPKSLNYQDNNACLSLHAVDTLSNINANAVYYNFEMDMSNDSIVSDNEGPEIELEWTFRGRDDGDLDISLYDEQGILHYENYIGRDILLIHESALGEETMNLNALFKTHSNDYTRGDISISYESLAAGEHIFTLRAWDTHNNSSEKTITVNVEEITDILLTNVINKPNPFKDYTEFQFNYTKEDVSFDLKIDIFDVTGRKINTLTYNNIDNTTKSIRWNGCDSSGCSMKAGVFIYKLYIKDSEGDELSTTQKMIRI